MDPCHVQLPPEPGSCLPACSWQQLEALAQIGHWQWDCARQQSGMSEGVCRIFSQPSDWRPSFHEMLSLALKEDHDRIRAMVDSALQRKDEKLSYTYRAQTSRGLLHLHTRVQAEYGPDGQAVRLMGTTQDISEFMSVESCLPEIAYRDPVTELPNRTLLGERLQQALFDAAQEGQILGLLVLDLDRFKEINDTHGHRIGDGLLREAARRLTGLVHGNDMVARLGGDEYAMVFPNVRDVADLTRAARRILDTLARPFRIDTLDLFVSASIGISVYPFDGHSADSLLQYADAALYDAKARGRANFRYYSPALTAKSKERAALEVALHHAEPKDELALYYQPKIDLASGRLVGAEALLRWHHPTLGLVLPDKFIGIAEDSGLIVGIGVWVLTKACLMAQRWNEQGGPELKVAVNLSSRQFLENDLATTVRSVLSVTGCSPRWLELEITESLLLDDNEDVRATLLTLRELGISIAIDDFGTGYSALGYLKRFPINVLKIDRSFTRDVTLDRDSTELVKAMISMGRSLSLDVVAEGIETEAQALFLQTHGCHFGQGYHYGRPVSAKDFEAAWLEGDA